MLIIAVIGDGDPTKDIAELAEQVGEELGRRGVTLVCGGLGGVMEAACRGAKSAGGVTIGVLPGGDPRAANPWVDIPICTGLSHARNVIIVKTGWSVIAVGGAYGTLSEIGHAVADGTPVIGLRTWSVTPHGGSADGAIVVASDARDAVDRAVQAARDRRRWPADAAGGELG
jgi:uncharacterized protein (TIGR00725 family)